tara:strand:+ start:1043 stop:1273 length:231 start_codon:yes stop_codon:yes gene_type:complete
MANFSIASKAKKVVGTATFDKESDYKVVTLTGDNPKTVLLHKIQADKLISLKRATLEKDVKVKEATPHVTVTPISE